MFDIGFWELMLISVVGLVVLGPERLPVAIRSVARFFNGMKSMANNVKDELSQELKIQELQDNLKKAEQMGMKDLSPELKSSIEELKQAAQSVQRPYQEQTSSDENNIAGGIQKTAEQADEATKSDAVTNAAEKEQSKSS